MNKLISLLAKSKNTVVFTGAGVSTLSGIRDFRGVGGFYSADWDGMEVEDILSLDFFMSDPTLFYRWAREFLYTLEQYTPSVVHTVLATLEQEGVIRGVYTQNIDMLHQRAGSTHVWEIHGSPASHHCLGCGAQSFYAEIAPRVLKGEVPFCSICNGVIKPDVVFYGEQLKAKLLDQAYQDMARADLVLVLGSSLTVQPAASLPMATYYHGGKIVIVNSQETPLDKYAKLRFYDLKEVFSALETHLHNGVISHTLQDGD